MKSLKTILQSLHESQYLTARLMGNKDNKQVIVNTILLKNGKKLQDQLLYHWRNSTTAWAQSRIQETKLNIIKNKGRLSFLHCRELQTNYRHLCQLHVSDLNPTIFKSIENSTTETNHDQSLFKLNNTGQYVILLVSDYFIPSSNGLEKFYNTQRERKIWWMRYSANPSRYFVEPFDLLRTEHDIDEEFCKQCHSITIKSNFAYDTHDMESITMVPLNELHKYNDSYEKASSEISLIRSVINLDLTTCAMILDGSEHNRDNTLMLNRKLAPYQVLLAYQCTEGKIAEIMNDFCSHIEHVLRRAGLRLYDKPMYSSSQIQLNNKLMTADNLGIPYTIFVDENSIKTGLMKLRSRETTLNETIHISDIPNYLLNIFTH